MAIINITNENFEQTVMNSDKTVLLDFWAEWCGPCRMIAPTIDEIADENPNILVGKVNVDNEEALAVKFGIMSIPTLVVIKNGEITNRAVGLRSKEQLLEILDL